VKVRLLSELATAVAVVNHKQSAQLDALQRGLGMELEREIRFAERVKEKAKLKLLAHIREHGC